MNRIVCYAWLGLVSSPLCSAADNTVTVAFDYVGYATVVRFCTGDQLRANIVAECKPWGGVGDPYVSNRRNVMLTLVGLEESSAKGDVLGFEENCRQIARACEDVRTRLVKGDSLLAVIVTRIEYSLLRLVQGSSPLRDLITSERVLNLLPDRLFVGRQEPTGRKAARAYTYRNLLIIGIEIECFRKRHGRLPRSLAELDALPKTVVKDAWGNPVDYTTEGDVWQLYCPGPKKEPNLFPFDTYNPSIQLVGPLKTEGVWLSSRFSAKRVEGFLQKGLYRDDEFRKVILEEGSLRWANY